MISLESSAFINGIPITPIQMSKGLEFEEVIIPAANSKTYARDYDRSLLYVACTRAMHQLALICSGGLTRPWPTFLSGIYSDSKCLRKQ
ncbi:ATP-binding domain-containing protein [Desulfosporosinus shakirovi]|uniref:ATP-binding domain-containing protein n=1 Tax=Desulfosporosinus shakirovi TaxID=2885154 RepID=UPI0037BF7BB0